MAAEATLVAAGEAAGPLHLAIAFVRPDRIAALNREHRGIDSPTDVLAFPVDGVPGAGVAERPGDVPRELGDVVICPEQADNLVETVVHGVLHLCGYDHEVDDGEMLALQDRVVEALRTAESPA